MLGRGTKVVRADLKLPHVSGVSGAKFGAGLGLGAGLFLSLVDYLFHHYGHEPNVVLWAAGTSAVFSAAGYGAGYAGRTLFNTVKIKSYWQSAKDAVNNANLGQYATQRNLLFALGTGAVVAAGAVAYMKFGRSGDSE